MARGPAAIKNAPDPIGPGTNAWSAFDLYVEALRAGSWTLAARRKAWLRKALRLAGHADQQDAWCVRAEEMAREPAS